MSECLTALASLGAAASALFLVWQIWEMRRQFTTNFEDSFAREYRKIIRRIPVKAMFGETLSEQEQKDNLRNFYFYFDLCNEQEFYHTIGRVNEQTWIFWHDGMKSNFDRPAFKCAWAEVCSRAGKDFNELRLLFPPEAELVLKTKAQPS